MTFIDNDHNYHETQSVKLNEVQINDTPNDERLKENISE